MGLPLTFLVTSWFFPVGVFGVPGPYREGGHRTSLPIGPATAANQRAPRTAAVGPSGGPDNPREDNT
jgi:hypothetical protein